MASGLKPASFSAVLAVALSPWATNLPEKPILFKAAFAVWLFMAWRGSFLLEKTCSRFEFIGCMTCKISNDHLDHGTICFFLLSILSAGLVQRLASRSISTHRAPDACVGCKRIRSYHSISQQVGRERFDMTKERISDGNTSGRKVGIFFGFFSIATLMPDAGFASIRTVLNT
jgi:hypothetical protein